MRWARADRPPLVDWRRSAGGSDGDGAIIPPRSRHSRPDVPVITRSEDQHGPLLRSLRQGFDGWLQSPVIGDEPRSRPPSLPAESPALHHHPEGCRHEGARLHSLPPNVDQELQVALPRVVRGRRTDRLPRRRPVSSCPGPYGACLASPSILPVFRPNARTGILGHGRMRLRAGEAELSRTD